MKKPITKKSSTSKKLPTILGTPMAYEYIRTNPVTETFIEHVCEKLLEYACSPNPLFVENFIREMRIPRRTFYNWVKKFPKLAETLEEAKFYIAYGRALGVAKRQLDRTFVMHNQYRFGSEWRDDDTYNAALKKKEEDSDGKVINVYTSPVEKVIDRDKYKPHNNKEGNKNKE